MHAVDEQLIALFLELAAIPGLSGQERAIADTVLRFARERGFAANEQPVPGGTAGNVVITHQGGGERMLTAHLDTARPTDALKPVRLEDRLRSDGSTVLGVDNRVGVATLLWTLERIHRGAIEAGPFSMAFTVREETDLGGSKNLVAPEGVGMVFVLDSALSPGKFIHRAPGARHFLARIHGRPAHAGIHPEQGIDAVQTLARGLSGLPWGRLDRETTANVGTIGGGGATNTVPAEAWADGEVRSFSAAAVDQAIGRVESALAAACVERGARLDFESAWEFEPFVVPLDAPVSRAAVAALSAAGLEPEPVSSSGGSDANALNARGLPALNFGIGARNPHSNEEEILYEDLAATARLAEHLVRG